MKEKRRGEQGVTFKTQLLPLFFYSLCISQGREPPERHCGWTSQTVPRPLLLQVPFEWLWDVSRGVTVRLPELTYLDQLDLDVKVLREKDPPTSDSWSYWKPSVFTSSSGMRNVHGHRFIPVVESPRLNVVEQEWRGSKHRSRRNTDGRDGWSLSGSKWFVNRFKEVFVTDGATIEGVREGIEGNYRDETVDLCTRRL